MSGATDELLATLTAAEAILRAAAAEVLSPAALMRVERSAVRAARRAVAEAGIGRTHELPAGWSEFVELDEGLDALLARLAPVGPAPDRAAGEVPGAPPATPRPVVVPPPEPLVHATPPPADVAPPPAEPPPPQPSPEATSWVVGLPDPDELPDDDHDAWDEASAEPSSDEPDAEDTWISPPPEPAAEAPETHETHAASDEAPAEPEELNERELRWVDAQWVSYEEQPAEVYEDDDEELYDPSAYDDDGISYITYSDPSPAPLEAADEEPLPAWAVQEPPPEEEPRAPRPTGKKKPEAPAPPPVEPEPPAPEEAWSFGAPAGEEPAADPGGVDPYAVLRKERMRLDDFSTVAPDPEPVPPTSAEPLPSPSLGGVPSPGRPRPAGPAAIQLAADGSSRVLGSPRDDDDGGVIELGDTRDYGDEEVIDDDQTGILGVGVVEYDEIEEIEEIEEVEPGLDELPGAPELTPAEISALMARAEEVGRRNMAEGALLYGDVLDADPDRVDALLARGRICLDLGDFPGAVSDFLKAEALQPRDPDVQVAVGDLFYSRKDYGKAVSYFNRALAIDTDHAPALARRGMAHYYRRQFAAAVEDLERAQQLDPSTAHVDTYLARARRRK